MSNNKISVGEYKKTMTPHSQSKRIHELFLQQLEDAGLPAPETELQFAKPRKWRFDFAWEIEWIGITDVRFNLKVAVEIEGGLYMNGGHSRGAAYEKNLEKYNTATLLGWDLYRFSVGQIKGGEAIEFMKKVFG